MIALVCSVVAAILTTVLPRNCCVELPMPGSEVAALSIFGAAPLSWVVVRFGVPVRWGLPWRPTSASGPVRES